MQVQHHYEDNRATSPCSKDKVRKRLGTGIYVVAQLMVMLSTFAALCHGFKTLHPSLFPDPATAITVASVSFSAFKTMKPWNLRKAKHESCLCKGMHYALAVSLLTLTVSLPSHSLSLSTQSQIGNQMMSYSYSEPV